MSQENIELVDDLVDAVARQDLSRLIELTDPEVEWHSFLAQLGGGGVYRGHDGMRQYVKDLDDAWDVLTTEDTQAIAVSDLVLVVGQLRYRGKGSGVETTRPAGWMLKFRNGKVLVFRVF